MSQPTRSTSGVDQNHKFDPAEVVKKLRFLIDAHHETVPGLARGIGVLPNTIQDVLDGQAFPSNALVRRIAKRFSLPLDFFVGSPRETETGTPQSAGKNSGKSTRSAQSTTSKRKQGKVSTTRSAPAAKVSGASGKQPAVTGVDPQILQQTLVELLVQKGVISIDEWNARLRLAASRADSKR